MKHVLLFFGLSSATLFGLAQNAPGAAGKASAGGSVPNPTSDTTRVQELVLREVYVIPAHIGHATQTLVLKPLMPAQHAPEVMEANFASLDLRSRGLNDLQSDLSVRGSTFDQVHVVVDGIPFTDPQTGHHSAILPIPIEAIQEITVLPSGGSYRYGPFAFAGVVELRSLDARSGRGYASASTGAFGYTRAAGGVPLRRTDRFGSRLDLSYTASDGASPNTDFATWQAYLKAVRSFDHQGELYLNVGYAVKMFGAQGFYSFAYPQQFEHLRSLTGSAGYVFKNFEAKIYARQLLDRFELFRENARYYVPHSAGRWIHATDSNLTPTWYSGANVHRNRSFGTEATWRFDRKAQHIMLGADARHDEITSNALGELMPDTVETNWGNFTRFESRQNAGLFASYQFLPNSHTSIQADLRLNANNTYGLDWLPNLGIRQRLWQKRGWEGLAIASSNRSFRLPTFTDLYYRLGGAQGSAGLRPEYAWNSELGLRINRRSDPRRGISGAAITAYERRGTNLIDWIYRTVDGAQVLQADNVTDVAIRGVEFEVSGTLVGSWSARAQFAGHQASDVNGQSIYVLDYLARRVQLTWSSALRSMESSSPLQFGLTVVGQDRAGSYGLPTGELMPYLPFTTVDLRASYRLGDLLLFADGMNLLNARVMDHGNLPLPGRWLKFGLRLEWE